MVRLLILRFGADVLIEDKYGGTPIVDAVRHGHAEVAKFLARHGATLEMENAAVAMCQSAFDNDLENIKLLIECGINVNEADYDSRTA